MRYCFQGRWTCPIVSENHYDFKLCINYVLSNNFQVMLLVWISVKFMCKTFPFAWLKNSSQYSNGWPLSNSKGWVKDFTIFGSLFAFFFFKLQQKQLGIQSRDHCVSLYEAIFLPVLWFYADTSSCPSKQRTPSLKLPPPASCWSVTSAVTNCIYLLSSFKYENPPKVQFFLFKTC